MDSETTDIELSDISDAEIETIIENKNKCPHGRRAVCGECKIVKPKPKRWFRYSCEHYSSKCRCDM